MFYLVFDVVKFVVVTFFQLNYLISISKLFPFQIVVQRKNGRLKTKKWSTQTSRRRPTGHSFPARPVPSRSSRISASRSKAEWQLGGRQPVNIVDELSASSGRLGRRSDHKRRLATDEQVLSNRKKESDFVFENYHSDVLVLGRFVFKIYCQICGTTN